MVDYTCGVLAIVVLVLCIIFKWQYSYWARSRVQGPAPLPLFGNYFECFFMQKHFVDVIDEIYGYLPKAKFTAFYKYHIPCLLVRDVSLISRILCGDLSPNYDSDFSVNENIYLIWKENVVKTKVWKQKSIQPEIRKLLSKEKFAENFSIPNSISKQLLDYIDGAEQSNTFEGFEAKELTTKYTLEALIQAAIDIKANCFLDEESVYLNFYRKYFTNYSSSLWLCFMKEVFSSKNIEHTVGDIVKEEILMRRNTVDKEKCFFDLLVSQTYDVNNEIVVNYLLGLMEAFEAANTLMAYCLYQLAINEDVQRKVRAEIKENLYLNNGELTEKVLSKLHYLDSVLFETLRLHSHLFVLNRQCNKGHNIPPQFDESTEEVFLEEGSRIVIPIYSIHLDAAHYTNPYRFNPERYLNFGDGTDIRYPFLGFGKESEYCLGMVYAFMQTKLGIATIVSRNDIRLSPKTSLQLNFSKKTLKLFYEEGIWLNFHKMSR